MGHGDTRTDLRSLLGRIEAVPPGDAVTVVADELADAFGAREVGFLMADYCGRAVVRVDRFTWTDAAGPRQRIEIPEVVDLPGTVYQRVLRTLRLDVRALDDGSQLTVPVTVRGDVIGLMELTLPSHPDEHVLRDVEAIGHALGYIVVTNRRYTDLFEWCQRTVPFSLAAEIQRRLLPTAFTYDTAQFTVSGWLEPASTVGGDTFDYALDRDTLHVSITDAVGHDVNAALLANVLVGSLRNGRRRGMTLGEQASTANDALVTHSPVGDFVTGQLVRVDLDSGLATIVNAGHPFPFRMRDGRVEEVELDIDIPFGLCPGRSFRLQEVAIEPGDRLVLVTDGVLERNSVEVDLPGILERTRDLAPRELVQSLGDAVLQATGGNLRDDATVLCLDWHGGPHRDRAT